MEQDRQQPVARRDLRISDQDRDTTLDLLGQHAAAGRLTLDELEDRAGGALAAKTRAELDAVTGDLPVQAQQRAARRKPVRWMVAVMGGSHRRGRFRTESVLNVVAVMGGDEVDLRDAEIDGGELAVNAISIMGGATIYLPETVDIEVSGVSIMGGNVECGAPPRPRPGAPLVRIRSYSLMGGNTIWRLPPQARGLPLREATRLARAVERGELPERS